LGAAIPQLGLAHTPSRAAGDDGGVTALLAYFTS
jgi:hypothetical protein